ncbi:hypothetical protein MTR67_045176 [Solanum verrucosum]|uniref:Uncharacterized protein n=1 Tax=Solanum verrucosum TaxID=315347 RepID=A0AAF0UVE3_SOLVR|nr:hypothetical protein MTR67_045176 [Solanum verrucosum]
MRWVACELTWLNRLLLDLSYPPELPIPVHSDSQSTIHIARNPIFHERTKHVELDCHFVRQQFLAGLISLSYVPVSSQLADLFTKALFGPSHHTILPKLGLSALPSNLGRGGGDENGVSSISQKNKELEKMKSKEMRETFQMLGQNSDEIFFPSSVSNGHLSSQASQINVCWNSSQPSNQMQSQPLITNLDTWNMVRVY